MELWFTELQSKSIKMSYRVKDVLHTEKTKYQNLAIIETEHFGRMLILDDVVQLTMKDEFIYHEMMAHVPLVTHGNPERVLVIGGGDGGTLREILKHPVKEAHLVEIDERVIEASKKFFPALSVAFEDPRAKVFCEDGIAYVKRFKNYYDVIIVDSTDPVGPAVGLFAKEFYKDIYEALTDKGVFVAQTESPFYYEDLLKNVYSAVSSIFPHTAVYTATIPTYPGSLWTFTMGSKQIDPLTSDISNIPDLDTKYYTPSIQRSCFNLPAFINEIISK
ncbi:polyamine aminopropyltransferase [Thermosediminibacter oceani]|uniref:Polyamine aminopropyltransferase n=1 Tax=Thermosediminibacter oceani (strain ATCC BAA-1034 / DSM 16646 / JW/IW-1228P) TaxID=555079 RepID=D9S3D3_THEOJ|nr:polyamine aminopropyltransferase [Thermosediminibacter oceani]ADL07910.1 spermidine synthase [Thermosediminibacter oceani DSM 16646]